MTPEGQRIVLVCRIDGWVGAQPQPLPTPGPPPAILHSMRLDGVWASASLLHLTSDEVDDALAEVRRVVRPGGVFYSSLQIGHAAGMVPPKGHEPIRDARYYTFWQPQDWRLRLEAARFEVLALDAADLGQAAEIHCNQGGSGWLTVFAKRKT